jgi:hypothetical protein
VDRLPKITPTLYRAIFTSFAQSRVEFQITLGIIIQPSLCNLIGGFFQHRKFHLSFFLRFSQQNDVRTILPQIDNSEGDQSYQKYNANGLIKNNLERKRNTGYRNYTINNSPYAAS